MQVVHSGHSSSLARPTLDRLREEILEILDGTALRVGRLLREAKQADPEGFDEWVRVELPFGHETARRLVAISAAHEKLPEEIVLQLPKPWQALYALRTLPVEALEAGISSGALAPDTTVKASKLFSQEWRGVVREGRVGRADVSAGALMQFPSWELSPEVRRALSMWLLRATAP